MMSQSSKSSSLGDGVYFTTENYAGLGRRFAILVIDLAVLVLVGLALNLFCLGVWPERADQAAICSWIAFAYSYLVIMEASSVGTIGFMVTRVKILNLKGERPSILRMTLRLLLWIRGPFNPLTDFLWLGGDVYRQTLRDKFVGTVVVKRGARPAGRGPIHVRFYALLGLMLVFAEVQKHKAHSNLNIENP